MKVWYCTTSLTYICGVYMPSISLIGPHLGTAPQHSPQNSNFLPRAFHPCNCPENVHLGHLNTFIAFLKISDLWLLCQSFHNIFKFHHNTPSSWGTSTPPITLIFSGHTLVTIWGSASNFQPILSTFEIGHMTKILPSPCVTQSSNLYGVCFHLY